MCHGNDLATASGQPLAACQHSNNLVGRQNTIITIFRKVCRDRDFYFAIHAMQCWPPLDYNVAKCGWLAGYEPRYHQWNLLLAQNYSIIEILNTEIHQQRIMVSDQSGQWSKSHSIDKTYGRQMQCHRTINTLIGKLQERPVPSQLLSI